jgi:Zn-dependent protease/CBS domain-containing protein
MFWSSKIGTIAGTEIRVHVTFYLFLAWIGIAHYVAGGARAAADGILFIVLLFACVVAHEFGHIAAARRYGIRTPTVTLLPIGGVASLERIPERPREELVVALAGPAVNVVIAAVLILILGATVDPAALARLDDPAASLIARLAAANVFLVLFNLIPAFPMDGGRVLRALLATRLGYAEATRRAAMIGQGLAFALGFLGLFVSPMLVFVAIFVYLAASAESAMVGLRDATRGQPVADAMVSRFETLGPEATIDQAAALLLATTQREFPVVDGQRRPLGVLTADDLLRGLREKGPAAPVGSVMRTDLPRAHARSPLDEAMKLVQAGTAPAVAVVDGEDRLVGLLTAENLGEMMLIAQARGAWGPPPARPVSV